MFQFRFEETSHLQEKTQTQFRVGLAKSSTENDEYDPTREIYISTILKPETEISRAEFSGFSMKCILLMAIIQESQHNLDFIWKVDIYFLPFCSL